MGIGLAQDAGAAGPEHPVAAEHGLDLMLSASGEAMALLRLLNPREAVDPVRHLPDQTRTDAIGR